MTTPLSISRRSAVTGIAGAVAGRSLLNPVAADSESEPVSVTVDDQTTDGTFLRLTRLETDVLVSLWVRDADGKVIGGTSEGPFGGVSFDPGTTVTDYKVPINQPFSETQELTVEILNRDRQEIATKESAVVEVAEPAVEEYGLQFVEAKPESGFEYPYFLYGPKQFSVDEPKPLLVQPNNTGTATDDFAAHKDAARRAIEERTPRRLSYQLEVPVLVPVFPRPESDPVDWRHYVHQLDRDTLKISSGPLERVDRQLLKMVEDAQESLSGDSYPVREKIMLNGFSASGNFVDRFTVLHPERVLSVTAGGLNGMAVLPLEQAQGRTLNYHVGIADVPELTGEPVDLDALDSVNQFLYMGAKDENDTIPYGDAWTSEQLKETALEVYGEDMIDDRFPFCQSAYQEAGVTAQFHIYEGTGHTPRPAIGDILEFHRRSMRGEPVDMFGENIQTGVVIEVETDPVEVGTAVTFDATESTLNVGEFRSYSWDFGDGSTAAGPTVTHSFEEPGQYTVTLRLVDSTGETHSTTRTVTVEVAEETTGTSSPSTAAETTTATTEPTSTAQETTATTTNTMTTSETTTTTGNAAGPGIAGALGSLGGVTYLLKRRLDRSDAD